MGARLMSLWLVCGPRHPRTRHERHTERPVGYSVHDGQHQRTSVSDASLLRLCEVVPSEPQH